MESEQLEKIRMAQPFTYTQKTQEGGGQTRWQVDTTDLKVALEHKLKGERLIEIMYVIYNIKHKDKVITQLYSQSDEEAREKTLEYAEQQKINEKELELEKTRKTEYIQQWTRVKNPLVNETGAYHLMSLIDAIFSQIGYLSNLTSEEVKDLMWDDVVIPLHLSIVQNHEDYGITKGSRDEIVSLFVSMSLLILKASEEGWTGDRMSASVREMITTHDTPKKRLGIF